MRKTTKNKRFADFCRIIGKNVARQRGGMKKSELAAKAKVSRQTISAVENGKPISLENLIKIADALNVNPADFFITEEERQDVSYTHIMLLNKLSESFIMKQHQDFRGLIREELDKYFKTKKQQKKN